MSYSTTIQLSIFQNIDLKGKKTDKPLYGYRIFTDYGIAEYNNTYESVEELIDEINTDTVIEFLRNSHNNFYNIIVEDGGFYFNDDEIDLDDYNLGNGLSDDYDENYTEELFGGDEELEEEVQEILEAASKNLI